ncbi:hypothetical protein BMS3Bbin02_02314 [bacterium BMS3Bbin02]|nr:hypothetical protein BMS3Bbin02_02314 [bacterium BMS3Bbin02]
MPDREKARMRDVFRETYGHIDDRVSPAPDWSAVRSADIDSAPPMRRRVLAVTAAAVVVFGTLGFAGWPRTNVPTSPGGPGASVTTPDDAAAGSSTLTTPLDFGDCPVTIPPQPGFQPPDGYPATPAFGIWYGTEGLWTLLEPDGAYRQRKTVLWSVNFPGGFAEERPAVDVTWRRLDDSDESIWNEGYGNNAYTQEDGDFMIAGIDPHRPGCWEVTATYKGAKLQYVYFVPGPTSPSTTVPVTASSSTTNAVPSDPLFGEELPWVFLFDDGIDGVLAVDPTNRVASRSVVDGQRAGDQPYRLELVENRLIVGWGEIVAADIYARRSVSLGEATIYVPAFRQDRVWLIDYPGGRIGAGTPLAWQVSPLTGEPVSDPTPVDIEGFPAMGIPGGLAIETDTGIALWDAATGEVVKVLGTGPAFVSDVSRDRDARIAWCEDPCTELRITTIGSGEELVVTSRSGEPFDARSARFGNDLRFLAAPAGSTVVVVDFEDITDYSEFTVPGTDPFVFLSWAPFGPDLFASTFSYGGSSTTVVWHNALHKTTVSTELPFGGALSFVVIGRDQAFGFFGDDLQSPDDCPAPIAQPSGRTGICNFGF